MDYGHLKGHIYIWLKKNHLKFSFLLIHEIATLS